VPEPGLGVVVPIQRSGVLAQEFCHSVARAKVEAVFARSFYLRSGDAFICVGEPDIGNGPLTLLGNLRPLREIALQPGRSAAVCDRHITIGHSIRLTLDRIESWRPPPWPVGPSPARLIETCAALAQRAAIDAPKEGLARIGGPRIALFGRWLTGMLGARHARDVAVEEAVQGLIGFGFGLTPSGDDFLVGALAWLDAIGARDAHAALARAILDALPGSTAPLSACFLRAAAGGHVGETLHRAVSSIMAGDTDAAIVAVENVGHSSGWDMLAGITTTLRVAAHAGAPA